MPAETTDESPLSVLLVLPASLEVFVSPDESSDEGDPPPPPPPPPPPQEITRRLRINTVRKKSLFFIYLT